jgi:hypothetical protein
MKTHNTARTISIIIFQVLFVVILAMAINEWESNEQPIIESVLWARTQFSITILRAYFNSVFRASRGPSLPRFFRRCGEPKTF